MVAVKIISILLFVLSSLQVKAATADTLVVIFDRQNFVQGDSIDIEVYTEPYSANQPAQTLHLWIDNVKTGQRWKYRYPFLKGRYKIAVKINDSIPNGIYAFNFLLQNQFLNIKGKLLNATQEDKSVNFLAKAKNKPPVINAAELQSEGSFEINNLYYTDSVFFGFSPVKQQKVNKLRIALITGIDSVFVPQATTTEFIIVGISAAAKPAESSIVQSYIFSAADKKNNELLDEIILKSKAKKRAKEYAEANVSGLFSADNSITLDFYDSDELNSYTDIYSYLTAKIPGLEVFGNPENNQPVLFWRKDKTDIYVDEFADSDFSPYSISTQDIEMIKIFRPGTRMGLDGLGGAVAIYTKRNSNRPGNKLSNYSFYVKGYTQKNADWK